MFEKVNKYHPDKVADRIAGAIVDEAYKMQENPKIAVEVLIGHEDCHIIIETSVKDIDKCVGAIIKRLDPTIKNYDCKVVEQDSHLAKNQEKLHCGDNGIFVGVNTSYEEELLCQICKEMEDISPSDGKYILCDSHLTVCQSTNSRYVLGNSELEEKIVKVLKYISEEEKLNYILNPLGRWNGGTGVDTGATNRKLGSDMGRAATGGGLHGKDLSKADVSVNIYCSIMAQRLGGKVEAYCSIGSSYVKVRYLDTFKSVPFYEIVEAAREYIKNIGGFEKFAEYGLLRCDKSYEL